MAKTFVGTIFNQITCTCICSFDVLIILGYLLIVSTQYFKFFLSLSLSLSITTHPQMSNYPDFREPMKKREWTFSKFVDELKSHIGRTDEYIYYQDTLTDAVGTSIKHDFVHFNWRWLNDRKKRYNWGQLTTNLLLIGQPGNITPCHYDEQHNFFCEVCVCTTCTLHFPSV